jgi:monofunctional glycosyltransferase
MPFAPRRRRTPDDAPADRRSTRRVPTQRMTRPLGDDDRLGQDGDPGLGPPPSEPWPAPPPRSRTWPPAPPSTPAGAPPRRRRPRGTRRRGDAVPPDADRRGWRPRRLRRRAGRILVIAFVLQALVLLSLRWIDPPATAFMLANEQGAIQQSVPIEHVSRNFLAAVIAHEDQQLPYRDGAFTWDELYARAAAHLRGEEDPSGSTIPQQVAKNLFLNQEMSAWRKAVEAGLSMELALVVDDRRVLELYVDHAQLGPRIYGICSASWYYFDTPPSTLSVDQAVQLVGLLPSPGHVRRAPGGGLDFDVGDGLGWLSRSHVVNAQNRVPRHIAAKGFQPVEDAGIPGLAADQPQTDDDCSRAPAEVVELITDEGTR